MSRHPYIQHQGHHLFVRTTLWKTYIVCEECGVEYETAWNKLYERLGYRVHGLLGFIFVWLLLLVGGMPTADTWWLGILYAVALVAFIVLGRIGLNALQAFLLRRSNDLASHIF